MFVFRFYGKLFDEFHIAHLRFPHVSKRDKIEIFVWVFILCAISVMPVLMIAVSAWWLLS